MDGQLNPLSPNTAAFLESITFNDMKQQQQQPTSMPPSAFFPVPGRDTPEDSSPDSIVPESKPGRKSLNLSEDSDDNEMHAFSNHHKRKAAGNAHHHQEDDEGDSSDLGHDDKRQHGDENRKSRRASGDKPGGNEKLTKAQRRKEQNRAAQKAFRERREQKVKDLEEKVAELEAKSFGASVENENLRNILRRLQEENVALKQASFTFSMPINGAPAQGSANGQQTPTQNNVQTQSNVDWSQFATLNKVHPQVTKPPSPPPSAGGDSLRSIHDISPTVMPQHRGSSSSMIDTPESLVSIGSTNPSPPDSQRMPSLFSGAQQNSNGNGNNHNANSAPDALRNGPSPNESSPSSLGGSTNMEDVDALFRSFYPDGIDAVLANAATVLNSGSHSLQPMQTQMPQYTFLGQKPGLTSYADTSSNALAKLFGDSTSYRDTTAIAPQTSFTEPQSQSQSNLAGNNNNAQTNGNGALTSQAQWSNLNENSVDDFLASLSGSGTTTDPSDLLGSADDEAFSRQLDQLIAQSGGDSPFGTTLNPTFSPTNYLNMSPSPLPSLSTSQSPRSNTGSTSNVTSPQSNDGKSICADRVIHVVGSDGRVMRPSEVWTRMGMHKEKDGELLIDELCDEMRSKATCSEGRRYMKIDDVEGMYRHRTKDLDPEDHCAKDKNGKFDPLQCQAKLNEVYLQKNGVEF